MEIQGIAIKNGHELGKMFDHGTKMQFCTKCNNILIYEDSRVDSWHGLYFTECK